MIESVLEIPVSPLERLLEIGFVRSDSTQSALSSRMDNLEKENRSDEDSEYEEEEVDPRIQVRYNNKCSLFQLSLTNQYI